MFHDPTVTQVALPAHLCPPGVANGRSTSASAATAGAAELAPTSLSTVLGAVTEISKAAQQKAFPGVAAPVNVAVSKRDGDFQNNTAMALFGMLKASGNMPAAIKAPKDVAETLAAAMQECDSEGIFAKVEAVAGFVNIWISKSWQAARVQNIVKYGVLPPPTEKKKAIVDFSSPNVAKEMHVGHLRSTIIGDTICRMLEFSGHEVERVNHVGDWGTQFGMLISHLKAVFPDYATKPPPIADLQQFYKDAKKIFDEDEDFKKRAHEEVVRLQSGDGSSRYAWGQICDVSRREFEKVYGRLEVKLTEVGESFYNEYIPPVLEHLQQTGVTSDSDGALVIFPPGTVHEQPLIVRKSDGGFGYDSTDMAAVWYRLFEKQAKWIVYVTDAGQASHFELIFAAAKYAGWVEPATRIDHVPFGLVCGPDGKKYKTRSGDVVRLVDLLDEAVSRMYAVTVEHNTERVERTKAEAEAHGHVAEDVALSDEEIREASRVLGYGAVKYADLKSNRNSNYIFDYDRMLDPRGNTAVYMLYTGARLCSILRKAGAEVGSAPAQALLAQTTLTLEHPAELAVAGALIRFQEALERATSTLLPNHLCEYVYDLCGKVSSFVRECKVLGSPEQNSRVLLVTASILTIKQTLALLGIGFLDKI